MTDDEFGALCEIPAECKRCGAKKHEAPAQVNMVPVSSAAIGNAARAESAPVAAPAAPVACQAMFKVVAPEGVVAGQQVIVTTPDGQQVAVQVPQGCAPGTPFDVSYTLAQQTV